MREVLNETAFQKSAYEWFRIRTFYRLITHLFYNTKAYDEACALAGQAFQEFPDHVNICCLYGISMYNQGQYNNALDAFKKAEKLIADDKIENLSLDNVDTLCTYLAQTYIKLDNPDEALRYTVSYLQSHNKHENMLKLCLRIFRSKGSPENTVEFLSGIYNYKNIHDKMLLLRCAKDIGDIELAKLFIQKITPEELR